jgi:hypothetical protein
MKILLAEDIQKNWETFLSYIEQYIESPRKEKLLDFYKQYEERFMMMPASHKPQYHNCFPGGYVDHVNRVVKGALELHNVWVSMGVAYTYSVEELVFAGINHDLGKFGTIEQEAYLEQTDQWRRDKLGETYMFNDKLEYMSVPDRSLMLLMQHGIEFSKNEMLAIKLHDGLYDEANKPYLINFLPETKPRTSLIYIVHQADLMAARIEFEQEWFPKFEKSVDKPKKDITLNQNNKSAPVKQKALSSVKSEGLKDAMKNFFET